MDLLRAFDRWGTVSMQTRNDEDIVRRLQLGLAASPPVKLSAESEVEVHSLVSHDHIPLYLFAIKSLALQWLTISPVVHDDGTLTDEDVETLHSHVSGLRVMRRADADALVEEKLAAHPILASVRRNNVRILQLVDYFLLSDAKFIIGMDSDVVLLNAPDELIRWTAGSDDAAFYYSPEHGWEPQGVHWIPDALPNVAYVPYMCCGFIAADRSAFFDLDYIETLMARLPDDILYFPRYVTQMFYSLLGGRLGERSRSLGEPYRSGRLEWLPQIERRVLCHYFASHERDTADDNLRGDADLFIGVLNRLGITA